MKSSTVISFIAAAIILGAAILYAQTGRAASGPVGSFQLLAGHYEIIGDKALTEDFGIFRIDTRTGKTWEFINSNRTGKEASGWLEVNEYLVHSK